MGTFTLVEQLERKWEPVMEHNSLSPIKDNYRRAVTAILLENQEQALHLLVLQAMIQSSSRSSVAQCQISWHTMLHRFSQ